MSRPIVRAAVAAWFAPPNVAGLNKIYTAEPKQILESEIFTGAVAGTASGAAAYIVIDGDRESRIAMGGATGGMKRLEFDMYLVIKFTSSEPKSEDAIAANDNLIEAIKTRLRSDRTLGGTVFQAGEGNTLGAPDIQVVGGDTVVDEDVTLIWSAVKFRTVLMLTAT